MTNYRLFPSTNGPSTAVSWSSNFISGVIFQVTEGGTWFEGFWWWVAPTGQLTTARKFALWNMTGSNGGTVVPGTVVTSGTLTAGQWNYVPISTPVQLAIGTPYIAAVGVNGNFPDTNNSFGSGQTYAAGITNGPLQAFSGNTGSLPPPYIGGQGQGVFTTGGSDPSVTIPMVSDSTFDNFWIDVQVSDTAPAGYRGSYRVWPNKFDSSPATTNDAALNYTVGTEIHLTEACTLNNIWYFSPSGSGVLASSAKVWNIATGLAVASISSPTWLTPSGSAASAGGGWVKAAFTGGTTLGPGSYRVTVFCIGTSTAKDTALNYFGQGGSGGPGANGIVNGPLSVPSQPHAASGFEYDASASGATPPYSNGTAINAQPPFGQLPSGLETYPQLYAPVGGGANQTQVYWVDLEVTPLAVDDGASLSVTATITAHAIASISAGATRAITAGRTAVAKATRHRGASRTTTAAITATANPTRHRSASRTTTATITASATKTGQSNTTGARPTITAAVTATGTSVRHRGAARAVTAVVTAAARVIRHRSATVAVTARVTAGGVSPGGNRTAQVHATAHITARATKISPPSSAPKTGSWWGLLEVNRQAKEEFDYYAERPPVACPNDGEPLIESPPSDAGSGVQLFCRYDGWQYPRDWVRPSRR